MFEKNFQSWFKKNTPKEGLSENTTFTKQFVIDAWNGGYLAEFNKANEWHYMKDVNLPKVNELVLIKITGCFVLGWTNGTDWFNDSNNGTIIDRRMVIAWKEIVLPELPKESE